MFKQMRKAGFVWRFVPSPNIIYYIHTSHRCGMVFVYQYTQTVIKCKTLIINHKNTIIGYTTQSIPFFNKDKVFSSSDSASGLKSYAQLACAGKLINMDSIRPFVSNPKRVPASYTKLNST